MCDRRRFSVSQTQKKLWSRSSHACNESKTHYSIQNGPGTHQLNPFNYACWTLHAFIRDIHVIDIAPRFYDAIQPKPNVVHETYRSLPTTQQQQKDMENTVDSIGKAAEQGVVVRGYKGNRDDTVSAPHAGSGHLSFSYHRKPRQLTELWVQRHQRFCVTLFVSICAYWSTASKLGHERLRASHSHLERAASLCGQYKVVCDPTCHSVYNAGGLIRP